MLCLTLFMSFALAAQQRQITGTVTDISDNLAMIGVNILEKGTINSTVTGIDGKFSLNVTTENPVLTFSSIGYETLEVVVVNQKHLSVVMKEDSELLEEVLVGYGSMKMSGLTGSV